MHAISRSSRYIGYAAKWNLNKLQEYQLICVFIGTILKILLEKCFNNENNKNTNEFNYNK